MKKSVQLLLATLFLAVSGAFAQTPKVKTEKIPTPTVQCEMCKNKIENYLKRVDGVQTVKVDYKKKETTVKYITDRTNIEAIKTHIANVGYDAGDVTAEPEAYKKLPSCCKKKE
ncbi:heavy-metal-associated domain-containing protein [Parasegetibacter sp. NRK P23]|uniref:heavy-metal-associated domain-containing protein n=1 Tax=Parasegetibacter sp. NRK P23 TaxID=2942999 RepID=UPI002042EB89|nr:heavy-metal-associated domain-containing protein [Parasegetibacter sp. NRK P23]MCM5528130.1 cation transporter [Parasegetibacter sp. NRK P23]